MKCSEVIKAAGIVLGSLRFITVYGCRRRGRTCFNIVRSVTLLEELRNEREKGVVSSLKISLGEGGEEDDLRAVGENPSQEESSYLAARIAI